MKGEEFKRLRHSAGLSQSELAKELEVTIRSLTRWETGVNPIPKIVDLALRYVVDKKRREKKR